MSFLGRLNYISRFIGQSIVVCEHIFKLLKEDALTKWTGECQTAFDAIKNYLSILLCQFLCNKEVLCCCICLSRIMVLDVCLVNRMNLGRRSEQFITSARNALRIRLIILSLDLDSLEIETLFVFLYHIPHFHIEPVEVYFLESNTDRKTG